MKVKDALKLLSRGNGKLHRDILVWNLPAGDGSSKSTEGGTCGMHCPGCYAIKAQNQYPQVTSSRLRKLELSKAPAFMEDIISAIKALKGRYVRIHESGDFYSQTYVNRWVFIAASCPEVHFTAYTKQLHKFDFSILRALKNVTLIDSLHGGMINYGPLENKPKGALLCPCGVKENVKGCGWDCMLCYKASCKEKLEANGLYFKQH